MSDCDLLFLKTNSAYKRLMFVKGALSFSIHFYGEGLTPDEIEKECGSLLAALASADEDRVGDATSDLAEALKQQAP